MYEKLAGRGALRVRGGLLLALLLALSSCLSSSPPPPKEEGKEPFRYVVYYGDTRQPSLMKGADWAIVSDTYPLPSPESPPPLYLAYLSVGEVDRDGPIARILARTPEAGRSVYLSENAFWNSHVADIRNPVFRKALYARVERDLRKGFSGLFLDTLDSPLDYEERHPRKGEGLRLALVAFVETLHATYPRLVIVGNRGFPILPALAPSLSGVLFEDFCTRYSGRQRRYVRVDPRERQAFLAVIRRAQAKNPDLRLLALDYDDPDHPGLSRGCGRLALSEGFSHYVSDWQLLRPVPTIRPEASR
ncbi:MAG: endo alpha-1,4 polygalactosaminidase [Leptospirillia bacterium]